MATSRTREPPDDLVEGVLVVLRSCCAPTEIARHEQVLRATPLVAQAEASGQGLVDAVREALIEAIDTLPPAERRAARVMAGFEAGWEDSHVVGRTDRLVRMGILLTRPEDQAAGGLGTRRTQDLERLELAPAIAAALLDRSHRSRQNLRDRPIFAQVVNPELLMLYGQTGLLDRPEDVRRRMSHLTRMSLLTSRVGLVIPASYIFEVPGVSDFLENAREACEWGAIQISAPASSFDEYRAMKISEYRDDASNPYLSAEPPPVAQHVNWLPRRGSSAAQTITVSWVDEVRDGAALGKVVHALAQSRDITYRKAARQLARVPETLDGRAMITRYVLGAIGVDLPVPEQRTVGWLLSDRYLDSYLNDLDASILIDFEFGSFSAAVESQERRLISATRLSRIFKLIQMEEILAAPTEHWGPMASLRDSPEFDVIVPALYHAGTDQSAWIKTAAFQHRNPAPGILEDARGYVSWLGDLVAVLDDDARNMYYNDDNGE